jgi:hypothetical protein
MISRLSRTQVESLVGLVGNSRVFLKVINRGDDESYPLLSSMPNTRDIIRFICVYMRFNAMVYKHHHNHHKTTYLQFNTTEMSPRLIWEVL